jgi:hypothetical protein
MKYKNGVLVKGYQWARLHCWYKNISHATFSTKNSIWSGLGLNPGLPGESKCICDVYIVTLEDHDIISYLTRILVSNFPYHLVKKMLKLSIFRDLSLKF